MSRNLSVEREALVGRSPTIKKLLLPPERIVKNSIRSLKLVLLEGSLCELQDAKMKNKKAAFHWKAAFDF